jgi:high frequency lysogenization protein
MSDRDRIVALAGVFQAAYLVQQLARYDNIEEPAFSHSIHSILINDADSTLDVFGGLDGIRRGLEVLRDKMLGRSGAPDLETIRYVLSMVQLATKLARDPQMLQDLATEFELIQAQRETGETPPFDTIDDLAQLYSRSISTLTPRIMVSGEQGYLNDPRTAARVRTALLAGIRAAYLWHQLGGRRWHLLFLRKRLGTGAARLLEEGGTGNNGGTGNTAEGSASE